MDDSNRLMHYPQQGYGGLGGMGETVQQPTSPQQPDEGLNSGLNSPDGMRGHASINTILDQIMTITDQSLDEAQVFSLPCSASTNFACFLHLLKVTIYKGIFRICFWFNLEKKTINKH